MSAYASNAALEFLPERRGARTDELEPGMTVVDPLDRNRALTVRYLELTGFVTMSGAVPLRVWFEHPYDNDSRLVHPTYEWELTL